jgi:hypothetical protein
VIKNGSRGIGMRKLTTAIPGEPENTKSKKWRIKDANEL